MLVKCKNSPLKFRPTLEKLIPTLVNLYYLLVNLIANTSEVEIINCTVENLPCKLLNSITKFKIYYS